MKSLIIFLAFTGLGSRASLAEEESWFHISYSDGAVQVEVVRPTPASGPGNYSFEAVKVGPSGTSINRQSGPVPADQGGRAILRSRVSLEPGATLHLQLKVTHHDEILHSEVLEVLPPD
ncbi:curli-like amyloid fiber formation chaperone CsgH [Cribrihabitans neustonicus]|uniref:curli-like amyloid fiber formation chaperone CsgH n=1 Tax=Cribrihabitans neustonicus TaxID=1429085 RepID=UPI003B5C5673